ncbi:MAG: hypothetical protein A2756_05175 [Candidatus Ryanbacteria bacterium RIFCSPHIGHO2_01_FULL_48_27]|uniref:Uncharacterized protein n=1 Tax=Candidatus Ryanbacteria bacterium RIFCSPHIGHO2_01_FULL_48_27 TaxID=1802115 RepID=A0A1G2FZV3_9BACT|nr:MAG: hypothetical protein A2756_05175 [Candidatus Ryanbacteria bacterium RIFCSPHIGHO2_01_FULL_48_27]
MIILQNMNQKTLAVGLSTLVLFAALWIFPGEDEFAQKQSQAFAKEWIEKYSPTYASGGSNLSLVRGKNLGAVDCHLCYEFEYSFKINTGAMHSIVIKMEDGKITNALVDSSINDLTH